MPFGGRAQRRVEARAQGSAEEAENGGVDSHRLSAHEERLAAEIISDRVSESRLLRLRVRGGSPARF